MDKNKDSIMTGPPIDPDTGNYLRSVFWTLVGPDKMKIPSSSWTHLMREFVDNPDYVGSSTAKPKERAQRLANALTGGSIKDLDTDFMWKRFVEALLVLKIQKVTMRAEATRGHWKKKAVAQAAAVPRSEVLRVINKEDQESVPTPVSRALAALFNDTKKTATRTVNHILLKLFWQFVVEYQIDMTMWKTSITKYVHNPANCPALENRRVDKRNNLQACLCKTQKITWDRFLEAMKVIDVTNLSITFKFETENHRELEVDLDIDLTKLSFKSEKKDE